MWFFLYEHFSVIDIRFNFQFNCQFIILYLASPYLLWDPLRFKTNSDRFLSAFVFALGCVKTPHICHRASVAMTARLTRLRAAKPPCQQTQPCASGPGWYPIHNATLGSPLSACNPAILSNRSALFFFFSFPQREHISTVTELGREGWFHNIWHWKQDEERKVSVRTISMLRYENSRSTPRLSLSVDAGQRAGSRLSGPARFRPHAVSLLMILTATFVTALPRSSSLLLGLSPTLTYFSFSFSPLISTPSLPPTYSSQVQRWELIMAGSRRPWLPALAPAGPAAAVVALVVVVVVVIRAPGAAPASPGPVTSITTLRRHTRATQPTARPRPPWVQLVSSLPHVPKAFFHLYFKSLDSS